jgi:hypothetical protein
MGMQVTTGKDAIEQRVPHTAWHSGLQECTLYQRYRESMSVCYDMTLIFLDDEIAAMGTLM